uniref:Uncharacterized protein n=1 Tax=Siphoviridae sp. ctNHp14 TaxID=2827857 RepID=A0A8S5SLR3_9CAUD|nr:MAG TPA: hypothetical protein [Siphoviridae sp. ctNHp14]
MSGSSLYFLIRDRASKYKSASSSGDETVGWLISK